LREYSLATKTGKAIYRTTGLKSKILVQAILKKKNGYLVEMEFSVLTRAQHNYFKTGFLCNYGR